jgi:hypothetical protein
MSPALFAGRRGFPCFTGDGHSTFSLLVCSRFSLPFHTNDGEAGGEFRLWIPRNDRGGFSLTRRSPVGQEDLETMSHSQHNID